MSPEPLWLYPTENGHESSPTVKEIHKISLNNFKHVFLTILAVTMMSSFYVAFVVLRLLTEEWFKGP